MNSTCDTCGSTACAYHFKADGFSVRAWYEDRSKQQRADRWRIRARVRGVPDRVTGKPHSDFYPADRDEAVFEARHIQRNWIDGLYQAPKAAPVTLLELVERWCDEGVVSTGARRGMPLSDQTVKMTGNTLKRFANAVGPKRRPFAIPVSVIDGFVAGLRHRITGLPLANNSRNQLGVNIRGLYRWAQLEGWTDQIPPVKRYPFQRSGVLPWLEVPQWSAFLANAPQHLAIRAQMVMYTGLRRSEVARVTWDDYRVFGSTHTLSVVATKNHKTRAVPLTPKAVQALEQARALWPSGPFVFSDTPHPCFDMGKGFWKHAKALEISSKKHSMQAFRRACGARWLAHGIGIHTVAKVLGHTVKVCEGHYADIAERDLHRWFRDVTDCDDAVSVPSIVRAPALVALGE